MLSNQQENKASCFFQKFSKTDLYSTNVSLYFNGSKKVTSFIGLFATWLAIISMFVYSSYRLKTLLEGTEFKTQMAEVLKPLNYSSTDIKQLNEKGFDFALSFGGATLEPDIGTLQVEQERYEWDEGDWSKKKVTRKSIELDQCNETNFNHSNKDEMKEKGVYSAMCVRNKSMLAVAGAYSSDLFQDVRVTITPCQNKSDQNFVCQSEQIIRKKLESMRLILLISSYYFDKDDQLEPIKSYIKDDIYFALIYDLKSVAQLYISTDEAKIKDSVLPWSSPRLEQFLNLRNVDVRMASSSFISNTVLTLMIREDFWKTTYTKEVYSLTDFFSELGGMFNSIYAFGKIIVLAFAEGLFLRKLIERFYLFKNPIVQNEIQGGLQDKHMQDMFEEMMSRQPLSVSICQFLKTKFQNIFQQQKQAQNQDKRKVQLFIKARKRIKQELDIIQLLKFLREFKILKNLILKKPELLLLNATKEQVISDNNDSDEENKYCHEEQNPLIKFQSVYQNLQEIKQAMNVCKDSIYGQKLISGVFYKKIQNDYESSDTQKKKEKKKRIQNQSLQLPASNPQAKMGCRQQKSECGFVKLKSSQKNSKSCKAGKGKGKEKESAIKKQYANPLQLSDKEEVPFSPREDSSIRDNLNQNSTKKRYRLSKLQE